MTQQPPPHPFALLTASKNRPLTVILAGVGGSGSRMALRLAELHKGLRALGRPGLELLACDPKTVTQANLVRQTFYPCDVGLSKAETLITRLNLALGTCWQGIMERAENVDFSGADLVVSTLDSATSRIALQGALQKSPARARYHLDLGNDLDYGQWVLGGCGLPSPYEVLPKLLEPDSESDSPSCSALESLLRQDLYINDFVALYAAQLLWTLCLGGETRSRGGFFNLTSLSVAALPLPAVLTSAGKAA